MIVLGAAGNGFVLYATVRYNAIELDRASIMYLQVIYIRVPQFMSTHIFVKPLFCFENC